MHLIIIIIKSLFNNIFTYSIFFKVSNNKFDCKKIIISGIASIIGMLAYVVLDKIVNHICIVILTFIIQIIFLKLMLNNKVTSLIIINAIASAILYVSFTLSAIIELAIKYSLKINSGIINLLLILIIECILINLFFRIKRFSKGFSFLQSKTNSNYIEIIMINVSAIIIFAYCFFRNADRNTIKQMIIPFSLLSLTMIIMLQKTLTLYYKQKLLAKNIEDYKSELKAKDEQIKKLSDEKYKISKLNHEFYNRQKALELKVEKFISNANSETGKEIAVINQINKISKEYSNKLKEIKELDKLPSTKIEEIDDMFKYMQSECKKNNIDFKLDINGNIHYMVNHFISQNKLVTLIGDLTRDSIIAITSSTNKFKSIIAMLGIKDDFYEFCIYDSGIEFEIDTLLKLGLKPTTTYKNTGGSGMGFMTTFETMRETNASLIINEKKELSAEDYTKSVTIRFDGKNEYRILSYRADEIKNKTKDNRIIIEN